MISIDKVMFTGSPHFDDKGEEHVPEEPVRYVGKPTKEVDAAWDRLTDGELAASFQIVCIRDASLKLILIVSLSIPARPTLFPIRERGLRYVGR